MPRRTVRLRLTLLYGGLFLACGGAMLAISYLLVGGKIIHGPFVGANDPASPAPAGATPSGGTPGLHRGHLPPEAHQLLLVAGVVLAVMLLVSAAVGWIMAGRVLRPLRTITAATRRISEANLHERLAVAGPDDELKDLADTIDGLIARLDTAFDSQRDALEDQRRFVANASHELRGPLTLERTALETALADPAATVESLRDTCYHVLSASRQQERLIDALLALARGQRGLDRYEPFDLAAIAYEVLYARRNHLERLDLRASTALDGAPALGDPRLAERLVTNLIDNAIRHNVAHGHLAVKTRAESGRAVLQVVNSGAVVPPSEVDRLLRPFQRLGADRTGRDGHGLGLSIVAAIAAAHHAPLSVQARPAGGLDVEVHFPTAPP
jgi:signal transduction histidine kinase